MPGIGLPSESRSRLQVGSASFCRPRHLSTSSEKMAMYFFCFRSFKRPGNMRNPCVLYCSISSEVSNATPPSYALWPASAEIVEPPESRVNAKLMLTPHKSREPRMRTKWIGSSFEELGARWRSLGRPSVDHLEQVGHLHAGQGGLVAAIG